MNKELLEKVQNSFFAPKLKYIQTGCNSLDVHLAPYGKGTLIALYNNDFSFYLIEQFVQRNKKCLYFSFCQSGEFTTRNLVLNQAGISPCDIDNEYLIENVDLAKHKINTAKKVLEGWDLHIYDDSPLSMEKFEEIINTQKPDYIFIDNLYGFNLDRIPISFFEKRLKKVMRSHELTQKEIKIINSNLSTILAVADDFKETHISIEKLDEEISEIQTEISHRCFSDPLKNIHPINIMADYIAEQLKPLAVKYGAVIFIGCESHYYWRTEGEDNDFMWKSNIKSQILEKNSDIILCVERQKEEDGKQDVRFKFVKNSLGAPCGFGSSDFFYDSKTGKFIHCEKDVEDDDPMGLKLSWELQEDSPQLNIIEKLESANSPAWAYYNPSEHNLDVLFSKKYSTLAQTLCLIDSDGGIHNPLRKDDYVEGIFSSVLDKAKELYEKENALYRFVNRIFNSGNFRFSAENSALLLNEITNISKGVSKCQD